MPKYRVRIQATVVKDIEVEADTQEAAVEAAHQEFTTEADVDEKYEQETLKVEVL
jgi:hypothetical protein